MSSPTTTAVSTASPGPVDRLLGLFSDVRAGEGGRALLMLVNVFLILVSYYIIKTVREPLILTTDIPGFLKDLGIKSPAEVKAYAAAGQALVLMAFVPAYSWFASRVDRMKLVLGVTAFFVANILAFALAVAADVAFVGVFFYIWVGFFSLSIIAQFWSYANDVYEKEAGNRLFPIIGIGATAGSPIGAWIAEQMFEAHFGPQVMLCVAAALLAMTAFIYRIANRSARVEKGSVAAVEQRLDGRSGFSLVLSSKYILLIAFLLVLLNIVNTVGEFILSNLVVAHAAASSATDPAFDRNAYIGAFYGNYFFWVNVLAVLIQAFLASRIVKWFGLTGVLLCSPIIALGAYGSLAAGATLSLVLMAKTAENSADYSVMNTAKQLLWLPTTRDEKYKAKQAVDSFFVRLGDLFAAFVVFAGTTWLALEARGFAVLNLFVVALWFFVALMLARENRRLSAPADEASARRD